MTMLYHQSVIIMISLFASYRTDPYRQKVGENDIENKQMYRAKSV